MKKELLKPIINAIFALFLIILCGMENPESAGFCSRCGLPLQEP